MSPDRLFCDTALAARIERAEADVMAAVSSLCIPVAGGVATYAEPGSPFNKVAGLGFGGVPAAAELEAVEAAFAERGALVQVELAHVGDPAVAAAFSERGYRLASFENVLGMRLGDAVEPVSAPGVEVQRSGDDEFGAWFAVVADAFEHPDAQGVPSHEDFPRDVLERAERSLAAAGVVRYVALRDGAIAGGGSLRIGEGVAQLAGAATAPAHRRRGVQSALLAARLADAAAAGCEIAVVTTQPASKSQQNVQRRGFELLYTRAVLVN